MTTIIRTGHAVFSTDDQGNPRHYGEAVSRSDGMTEIIMHVGAAMRGTRACECGHPECTGHMHSATLIQNELVEWEIKPAIKRVILAEYPRYSENRFTLMHETAAGAGVYVFEADLTDPGAGYGVGAGEYTLNQLAAMVEADDNNRALAGGMIDDWNGGSAALITDPGKIDDLVMREKGAK